jgi:hypothetical protein
LNYVGGITIDGRGFAAILISTLVSTLLRQKHKTRIITMTLIPAVSLAFLMPALPELVVFLFTWVYYSYVLMTERFVIRRGEFVDMLRRLLSICLILPFVMLASFHNFGHAVQEASPYLITALISAVFLLRHLRTDNQMEQMKQYKRQQFMELLAFIAVSVLLTFAKAPQNIVEGLRLLYQYLLRPVLSFITGLIGMLIGGIIYLITKLVGIYTGNKEMVEVKIEFGKSVGHSMDITDVEATNIDWVVPLLCSIGAIIGFVLLFYFFRWLMGEKYKQRIPSGVQESREYLQETDDKRTAYWKRRPKDPREAVRYYYGKYLLWLQHGLVELKLGDTTDEINDKYCILLTDEFEAKSEASSQLKKLYQKARYQINEQISREEAEIAKQLYQKIKRS